jgi:putative addiction module CopG family antidote
MKIEVDTRGRRYLASKVRSGQFKSPSEVVNFALNRLRNDERELSDLRREIQKGIDSLDRGEGIVWNVDEEKSRLLKRLKRSGRKS